MNILLYIKRYALHCLLFAVCISILSACTERMHISTHDAPERLVIYGYITNDTTKHSIRITRSTGYFATTPPPGVSNAVVTISSGDETFVLTESNEVAGLYQTEANVSGREGSTYKLYVSLDFDDDGVLEEFESSSYMPYHAPVDSIDLKFSDALSDHIEILLYGRTAPNEINYFSFQAFKNGVGLNDSLKYFSTADDKYLDKEVFNALPCFFLDQDDDDRKDLKLQTGDTITLRIDVLTKEYENFLVNAQNEVGGSNPMFGGPPANVETNIRSIKNTNNIPISGFFSAYSSDQASTVCRLVINN